MKTKTIKINNYIFVLSYNKDCEITSSHFLLDDNPDRDMTKKEIEIGRKLQQQIFDGKHDLYMNIVPYDMVNVKV